MKKHPVDDLFKSKLSGLEKQPSSNAWSRINNEQKVSRQRFTGWVWYAAATVTVAVLAGYMVWQGDSGNSIKYSNSKTIAGTEKLKKIETRVVLNDSVKHAESVNEENKKMQIAATDQIRTSRIRHQSNNAESEIEQVYAKANSQNGTREIASAEDYIKRIEPLEVHVEVHEPVSLPDILKDPVVEPVLASVAENQENRTIIVKVDDPSKDADDDHKASRFTRVFRQLKNVRAGEPVNWRDVGFDPKVIVAKVDEKIRNKEDVISEKYQTIKERTKL